MWLGILFLCLHHLALVLESGSSQRLLDQARGANRNGLLPARANRNSLLTVTHTATNYRCADPTDIHCLTNLALYRWRRGYARPTHNSRYRHTHRNTNTYRPNTSQQTPNTSPYRPNTSPYRPNTSPHRPNTSPYRPPNTSLKTPNTSPTRPDTSPARPNTSPTRPNTSPAMPNTSPNRLPNTPARYIPLTTTFAQHKQTDENVRLPPSTTYWPQDASNHNALPNTGAAIPQPSPIQEQPAQEQGTRGTEPGTTDAKPGTRDTEPGTRGTETGTRGTEPGARGTEPGTRGTKTGTRGTEPGTRGTETGTRGTETGTRGTEPGTVGIEPGTVGTDDATQPITAATVEPHVEWSQQHSDQDHQLVAPVYVDDLLISKPRDYPEEAIIHAFYSTPKLSGPPPPTTPDYDYEEDGYLMYYDIPDAPDTNHRLDQAEGEMGLSAGAGRGPPAGRGLSAGRGPSAGAGKGLSAGAGKGLSAGRGPSAGGRDHTAGGIRLPAEVGRRQEHSPRLDLFAPALPANDLQAGRTEFPLTCSDRCKCGEVQAFEDGCEVRKQMTTPYRASSTSGTLRTIVQLPNINLMQEVEVVTCSSSSACQYGGGNCVQERCEKPLLVYDDGKIFVDYFPHRACCRCEEVDLVAFLEGKRKKK